MTSDLNSNSGPAVQDRNDDLEDNETAGTSTSPTRPAAKRPSTETSRENQSTDAEMIDGRPKDEFDRFTKSQKRRMTAIVSFSALLSRRSLTLSFWHS
jgi:hypothetical protein